jgi:hypothetical protein
MRGVIFMAGAMAFLGLITWVFLIPMIILCIMLSINYKKAREAGSVHFNKAYKKILKTWGIWILCLFGGSFLATASDVLILAWLTTWIGSIVLIISLWSKIKEAKIEYEYLTKQKEKESLPF